MSEKILKKSKFGKIVERGSTRYKVFETEVRGEYYGFNVDFLKSDEEYAWFLDVIENILSRVDYVAYDKGSKDVQNKIKKALGIMQ